MPTDAARRRARAALSRLARADMDNDVFRHEAAAVLRNAIGFDSWCWALIDPAVGLPTRAISVNSVASLNQRRFYRLSGETWGGENASVARRNRSAVTVLSAATGGDLNRDRCWRELLGPSGAGDVLTAWLGADGACWAYLHIGRDSSGGRFTDDEAALIAEVARPLATRLRDALRATTQPRDPCQEPGIIIVDRELSVVAATGQAWRWLDGLGLQRPNRAEPLPGFVYAITTRVAASGNPPSPARVRLQAADGRWVIVQAAALSPEPGAAGTSAGYAITIEAARSEDVAPLLMRAWALSPRERDVARLVIDGLPTKDIAATLFISHHTVRDHLKAIFDKIGAHSRRDLVAALAGAALSGAPGSRAG